LKSFFLTRVFSYLFAAVLFQRTLSKNPFLKGSANIWCF
jgi:hypothetical protein